MELCRHVLLHGVVVEVLSKPEEQEGWKGELLAGCVLGPCCPPCCCGAKFGTDVPVGAPGRADREAASLSQK